MKTINKLTVFTLLLISIYLLESCRSSSDPFNESEEQVFLKELVGVWKVSEASYDEVDVTESFPGLILSIAEDKRIQVENPVAPMWVSTSSFTLEPSGNTFQISRNDGLLITVVSKTPQKLILSFTYDATKLTGRVKSVVGNFSFVLIK